MEELNLIIALKSNNFYCISDALCNLVGRTFLMVTLIIITAFALCNLAGRTYLKVTLIIIIAFSLCNLVGTTYLKVTLIISLHLLSVTSWVEYT